VADPSSRSAWMSSTNACGSSKRVSGSRPATLRNSLSPCTAPSIHLAHTSRPARLPPISTLATCSSFLSSLNEILACVRLTAGRRRPVETGASVLHHHRSRARRGVTDRQLSALLRRGRGAWLRCAAACGSTSPLTFSHAYRRDTVRQLTCTECVGDGGDCGLHHAAPSVGRMPRSTPIART
jgi:hypothetical protein